MRDRRFVTEHRGGRLKRNQHLLLMNWACVCAEHILPLGGHPVDKRLLRALDTARNWMDGKATVGECRKAAVEAHAAAREASDPKAAAVARAAGHAAATAHMADHALGPAWYALKAVREAGGSAEAERRWQDDQLPPEIRHLVLSARKKKGI